MYRLKTQSIGKQSPPSGHYSLGALPSNQLIQIYLWVMLSTPKAPGNTQELRSSFSNTDHKKIASKVRLHCSAVQCALFKMLIPSPTPDQISLINWFPHYTACKQIIFLSWMVRLMQKRFSAAGSSLSSSFLESLLKMYSQLQDYTCSGDACGSQ